jgi:CRISPR-associated protein Csm3
MVFEKLTDRRIIKGEIISETPLHIGSGKKDLEIEPIDTPIITDTSGQPYIPGSSIKGKVRSEAERIARQNGQVVCNPPQIDQMCGTQVKNPDNYCICCKIFGTAAGRDAKGKSVASKVKFRDSYPLEKIDKPLTRAVIALDRDTGSVSGGALAHTEAVPTGTKFDLEIVCDNMTEDELKLLRAALKSVQDSALGGYSSRGFGKVKFRINKLVKRSAKYYLGDEPEIVEGEELKVWQKELGVGE